MKFYKKHWEKSREVGTNEWIYSPEVEMVKLGRGKKQRVLKWSSCEENEVWRNSSLQYLFLAPLEKQRNTTKRFITMYIHTYVCMYVCIYYYINSLIDRCHLKTNQNMPLLTRPSALQWPNSLDSIDSMIILLLWHMWPIGTRSITSVWHMCNWWRIRKEMCVGLGQGWKCGGKQALNVISGRAL